MSQALKPGDVEPVEIVFEREGPVILNPAAFAGPKELDEYLADPGRIDDAVTWIAQKVGGALGGYATYDAVAAKVVPFLMSWRQRHGQAKLDELKADVLAAFEQGRADPDAVRKRVDELFQDAEG